jgi:hypothetical protein
MMALPHLLAFWPRSLFFTLQLLPRPGPPFAPQYSGLCHDDTTDSVGRRRSSYLCYNCLRSTTFGGIVAFEAAAFDGAKEVFVKAITKFDGVAAALVTAAPFSVAATFDMCLYYLKNLK